jgi:hypothetical protein
LISSFVSNLILLLLQKERVEQECGEKHRQGQVQIPKIVGIGITVKIVTSFGVKCKKANELMSS